MWFHEVHPLIDTVLWLRSSVKLTLVRFFWYPDGCTGQPTSVWWCEKNTLDSCFLPALNFVLCYLALSHASSGTFCKTMLLLAWNTCQPILEGSASRLELKRYSKKRQNRNNNYLTGVLWTLWADLWDRCKKKRFRHQKFCSNQPQSLPFWSLLAFE